MSRGLGGRVMAGSRSALHQLLTKRRLETVDKPRQLLGAFSLGNALDVGRGSFVVVAGFEHEEDEVVTALGAATSLEGSIDDLADRFKRSVVCSSEQLGGAVRDEVDEGVDTDRESGHGDTMTDWVVGVKLDDVGFFRKMSSKLSRYESLGGGNVVLL